MRRIAGTCRVAAAAALLSVPTIAVLPAQAANPEGFHVQFGTRVQGASAAGGGDSGRLVGESRSGAVIVAATRPACAATLAASRRDSCSRPFPAAGACSGSKIEAAVRGEA